MSTKKIATNRYSQLIEAVFFKHYHKGATVVPFLREDLGEAAEKAGIKVPKNIGDLVYSFRYRVPLPESILKLATGTKKWVIRLDGIGRYKFCLASLPRIAPNPSLAETKIPDATPGIIRSYALGDEQALLAILRYNRPIDIFTGVTCYSLQNHLRTTVPGLGQIETDEIYIGIDKRGCHYAIPVQAKGGSDQLGIVQMEQDIALCEAKFPSLVCIPVAAQFMEGGLIALFAFEKNGDDIAVSSEKHYRLVEPSHLAPEELELYRHRLE